MDRFISLFGSWYDFGALVVFLACWIGYEPILRLSARASGVQVRDMFFIRRAWMKEMVFRSFKLYDSNLVGHSVNSTSFFASANLILIAAVGGAVFTGNLSYNSVHSLGIDTSSEFLMTKLALVMVCLSRGLLDFIWALRQTNYCVACMGAVPENVDDATADAFAAAITNILEPAMSNFSQGVRGYYFSLAAAAWLFGPLALIIASIGATALLVLRHSSSRASTGLRQMRILLAAHPYPTRPRPLYEGEEKTPLDDKQG